MKNINKFKVRLFLPIRILFNYFYDNYRYLKYSTIIKKPKTENQLLARISVYYHVIEKGLSFNMTRLGFGKDRVLYLCKLLDKYEDSKFNLKRNAYMTGVNALISYYKYHQENDYELNWFPKNRSVLFSNHTIQEKKSTREILEYDIKEAIVKDYYHFINSRNSIRDFDDTKVSLMDINSAIKLAQNTPSSCNRQSQRVYVVTNNNIIEGITRLQNGNRGFGDKVSTYIVISVDLNNYIGIYERNLMYIDGGIYLMSLINSLHFYGLATCILNWAVDFKKDIEFKRMVKVKRQEVIVGIIAVGNYKSSFKIANSAKTDFLEYTSYIT
jgi:hypothetical protein